MLQSFYTHCCLATNLTIGNNFYEWYNMLYRNFASGIATNHLLDFSPRYLLAYNYNNLYYYNNYYDLRMIIITVMTLWYILPQSTLLHNFLSTRSSGWRYLTYEVTII